MKIEMQQFTEAPYITFSELRVLRHAPGILEIDIKQVNDHFMPFALFTKRGQDRVMHGTIMMDGKALASRDLNDLIEALHSSLGSDFPIHVNNVAETALH